MKISISANTGEALRVLVESEEALRDLRPVLTAIAGEIDDRVRSAFELERDPVTGAVWPELRPAYRRWRERKGYGTDMLELTGILKSSIVPEVDDRSVTLHTSIEYGAVHQEGKGHVPQRRFAGISPEDGDLFVEMLRRHVLGGA